MLNLSLRTPVHLSHRLFHHRGLVWCGRCGAFGVSCRAKLLLQECTPPGRHGAASIWRTLRGKTPDHKQQWLY